MRQTQSFKVRRRDTSRRRSAPHCIGLPPMHVDKHRTRGSRFLPSFPLSLTSIETREKSPSMHKHRHLLPSPPPPLSAQYHHLCLRYQENLISLKKRIEASLPPPPVPVFIAGNRARGALCCPTLSHAGRAASPSLFLFAWRSVIGNNMAAAVKIVVVLAAIVSTGR